MRTLPVGELPLRGRAERPPVGGGSIAAAVEAFLTVAPTDSSERQRNDEPSGTHRASELEGFDEEEPSTADDTEARDRSVVDAVLAMLGPSPVAQLLRMPKERMRGGAGGTEPATENPSENAATSTVGRDALDGRTLRDLGIVSEGASLVASLPSAYPTIRPATPRRSLSEIAMDLPPLPGPLASPHANLPTANVPTASATASAPRVPEQGDAVRAALETAAHRARARGRASETHGRMTLPPDTVGRPKDAPSPKTSAAPLPSPAPSETMMGPKGAADRSSVSKPVAPAIAPAAIAPAGIAATGIAATGIAATGIAATGIAATAIAPGAVVVTEAVATGVLRPKVAAADGLAAREHAAPAPKERGANDRGDVVTSEPSGDETIARSLGPSSEGAPPTHERRIRRDDLAASTGRVEATGTETARAVHAPEAITAQAPTLEATLVPVTAHEAPSLAPSRQSIVHDPHDSLFPERPPLAAASFLTGSILPGSEGATTRLELQHPTLGALTLHLAQMGDGVSVDFSAPTLDAAIALRASEEGLRAELREGGSELGGFRVRTRRAAITNEGDARETEAWQPPPRHDRRRV